MSNEVEQGIDAVGGDTGRYFNSTLRQKKEPAKRFEHKTGTNKQDTMKKTASVLGRFVLPVLPDQVEDVAPMDEMAQETNDSVVDDLLPGGDVKSQKPAVTVRSIMGIPNRNDD